MKKIIFFMFLSLQLSAQEFLVKKGVVVDDLKVSDTLEESYALYLPTSYQNERPWPVLFIFDPEGRGKTAAQLFQTTAEEQGYIIASSNAISRQKDLEQNVLSAAKLMQRIAQVVPIDSRQIVTVGAMAGARVASSIPLVFDNILGAVAVGDHWVDLELLDKNKNFAFIGIVGDEQFSGSGMKNTANRLSRLRNPSQVYTYDGDEEWPQPGILNSAVGSITLEAMRRKFRPVDPELVERLYKQDLGRVNKLMSLNQLVTAHGLLEIMEEKYSGFISPVEIKAKQDQLSRSRNFNQQAREQNTLSQKEARLRDDFIYYLEEDIRTANFENLGWWNYQKKQLDSLARKSDAEGKMALRLEDFISEYVRLTLKDMNGKRMPAENKLVANIIRTIFDPRAYEAYRNIISLSAMDADFPTAYFYLEEMLKHGYDNLENLYNIEGTLGLRLTPEYNQIIEKYLGTSKFYDAEKEGQK